MVHNPSAHESFNVEVKRWLRLKFTIMSARDPSGKQTSKKSTFAERFFKLGLHVEQTCFATKRQKVNKNQANEVLHWVPCSYEGAPKPTPTHFATLNTISDQDTTQHPQNPIAFYLHETPECARKPAREHHFDVPAHLLADLGADKMLPKCRLIDVRLRLMPYQYGLATATPPAEH